MYGDRPDMTDGMAATTTTQEAFCLIATQCCQAIDAHLAVVLGSELAIGPLKARVALRRLTTVLDAFGPLIKQRRLRAIRHEGKTIFRLIGILRDAEVRLERIDAGPAQDRQARKVAETRAKLRQRLRRSNAVGYAPGLLAQIADESLFRSGKEAKALRAAALDNYAALALDAQWDICAASAAPLMDGSATPSLQHRFRKDAKALRYLSEFFAPLIPGEGAAAFRADMRDLQDALGVLTDAQITARPGKSTVLLPTPDPADAGVKAKQAWQSILTRGPWWKAPGAPGHAGSAVS